jgi:hypothetical protein
MFGMTFEYCVDVTRKEIDSIANSIELSLLADNIGVSVHTAYDKSTGMLKLEVKFDSDELPTDGDMMLRVIEVVDDETMSNYTLDL